MRNESYGLGRYHGVPLENYISGLGVWQGGTQPSQKAQNNSFPRGFVAPHTERESRLKVVGP